MARPPGQKMEFHKDEKSEEFFLPNQEIRKKSQLTPQKGNLDGKRGNKTRNR